MTHLCDAKSHKSMDVSALGRLVRSEQREQDWEWPKWGSYFKTGLEKLTFVQIGANNGLNIGSVQGDPIYDYATKYHWKGLAIEPNPNSFKELKANYAPMKDVTPLQLAVSDTDGKVSLFMEDGPAHSNEADTIVPGGAWSKSVQVPALTIQSLWSKYVSGKFPAVDILVIDVEGAEPKVLQGTFAEPKPRFILYEYYHLNRADLRATRNTLVTQGYRYVGRGEGDELHELIKKGSAK